MGGGSASGSASLHQQPPPPPKILLAKPPPPPPSSSTPATISTAAPNFTTTLLQDDSSSSAQPPPTFRSRLPSFNLLLSDSSSSSSSSSSSWDFTTDRFLPFLTDNTDFTVIGVIGPPGVGKSTILNQIYGYDPASPGMLPPPFPIQSDDTDRALAKHSTLGIEPRISSQRIILLDTQPVFSPSVLADMIRPDGSSTLSVITGESLSAELAHELMTIQLGVFLTSVCHIILVVSEGVHDLSMWRLMSTVDLLKHGIPDPSFVSFPHLHGPSLISEKENKDKILEVGNEFMATLVFVHTKLRDKDVNPHNAAQLKKALQRYYNASSFLPFKCQNATKENSIPAINSQNDETDFVAPKLFLVPSKNTDDSPWPQYESYTSVMLKLRNQVLSMSGSSFLRTVSERDWLKNSAKIWDMVKNSGVIADYCRTLQSSGMFRR